MSTYIYIMFFSVLKRTTQPLWDTWKELNSPILSGPYPCGDREQQVAAPLLWLVMQRFFPPPLKVCIPLWPADPQEQARGVFHSLQSLAWYFPGTGSLQPSISLGAGFLLALPLCPYSHSPPERPVPSTLLVLYHIRSYVA